MTLLAERNNIEDTVPQIAGVSHGEGAAPLGVILRNTSDDNATTTNGTGTFQEAGQQSNIHYDLMPAINANTVAAPIGNTEAIHHQQQQEAQEEEEEDSEMVRKWKESPFAVGLTKATWADEDMGCAKTCFACCTGSKRVKFYCTACICSRLGAGRVGNMIVLRQTMEEVVQVVVTDNADETTSGGSNNRIRTIRRPRLRCVVGPYWMVTFFLVVPFFTVISYLVERRLTKSEDLHLAVFLVWIILTVGLFFSLFLVACSDPGIHYRHSTRPDIDDDGDDWIWNDQALSYRPQHAKFDPEVQCIVNHFDHVCPWTSTAIGGGNILWFYMFLFFVFGALMYDIMLLTFFGH